MKILLRICLAVLTIGLVLGSRYVIGSSVAQSQSEGPVFELNAGHLQTVGLHLPSYMPGVLDLLSYQAKLSTHQELTIEWELISGVDHPVKREEAVEGSLLPNFKILDRKHSVLGHARSIAETLTDLTMVVAAVTSQGEIRGLSVGPGSPRIAAEFLHGKSSSEMVNPRSIFQVLLPDDPKIEKLVFLLAHPDGEKYRLEQVGTLDLKTRTTPK